MKKEKLIRSLLMLSSLFALWEITSALKIVPPFLLPRFSQVIGVLLSDFSIILPHTLTTIFEAIIGLSISVCLAVILAITMDYFPQLYGWLSPLLMLSQTIPTVILAPLLVLWFGYGMLPKIILIVLVCFFPLTISLFNGFQQIDPDYIRLLNSFQASYWQMLYHVKIPFALPSFLSGLTIASSYSVIGAVIAEWLGGESGLGVYMTRVRKSFAFDKLFAAMLLISLLSFLLMLGIHCIERWVTRKKANHYKGEKS